MLTVPRGDTQQPGCEAPAVTSPSPPPCALWALQLAFVSGPTSCTCSRGLRDAKEEKLDRREEELRVAQAAGVNVEVPPRQVERKELACGTEEHAGYACEGLAGASVSSTPWLPAVLQAAFLPSQWDIHGFTVSAVYASRDPSGGRLPLGPSEKATSPRSCWQRPPYLLLEHHRSLLRLPRGAKGCVKGKSGPYRQHRPAEPLPGVRISKIHFFQWLPLANCSPLAQSPPGHQPVPGDRNNSSCAITANKHASEQTELVTVQDRAHRAGRTHHLQLPRPEF